MNSRKKFMLFALGCPTMVGCKNDTLSFQKLVKLKDISFEISTSGEGSLRQLYILPHGLSIDNRKLTHQLDGKVIDAKIEDLNSDGYPELVIYIQ